MSKKYYFPKNVLEEDYNLYLNFRIVNYKEILHLCNTKSVTDKDIFSLYFIQLLFICLLYLLTSNEEFSIIKQRNR